jgi:GNAT superfamily N-acetyltransferase
VADVFVRAARLIDASAFAAVQHRSWATGGAHLGVGAPPPLDVLEQAWQRAITAPPSDRHRTWVAIDSAAGSDAVVGAAAVAPATDPDLDAAHVIELVLFTVHPEHRRRGHGSRLLSAALQTAGADGETEAVVWLASADDELRRFLEAAGWAADGAFRTLERPDDSDAAPLREIRLGTSLGDRDEPNPAPRVRSDDG